MADTGRSAPDDWAGKKKVWVWFADANNAELKLSEILIYCYRVYQDEYDETPSHIKICRATGLSKQAVSHADQRLIGLGLIQSDRVVIRPPSGWFQTKGRERIESLGAKHWRHQYTHWESLVRNPKTAQGKITHLQGALYSFLWHCRRTDFQPREGWSVAYLAKVLKCKWQTIKDALLVLEGLGMVKHAMPKGDTLQLTLYKPTQAHLSLFQDAEKPRVFKRAECEIGVEDGPVPCGAVAAVRVYTPAEYRQLLDDIVTKVIGLTGYTGDEAEDLAWRLCEHCEDIEQVSLDLYGIRHRPLHERRARLERMVFEDDVSPEGPLSPSC